MSAQFDRNDNFPTSWEVSPLRYTVHGCEFEFKPYGYAVKQTALMIGPLVTWMRSLDPDEVRFMHKTLTSFGLNIDDPEDAYFPTDAEEKIIGKYCYAIAGIHDQVIAEHGDWPNSNMESLEIAAV